MKSLRVLLMLSAGAALLAAGCNGIEESGITGKLELNPKSGYSTVDFTDIKTKKKFSLAPGRYRIDFKHGIILAKSPSLEIRDEAGKLVGTMAIPAKAFKDDGTFELYADGKTQENENAFNILGGRRKIILDRVLSARLHASCTYTETYSCTKTRINAEGHSESYSSTCTRLKSGHRDELWARQRYKVFYRILFDGYDLMNVGQFKGDSAETEEDILLAADSCG